MKAAGGTRKTPVRVAARTGGRCAALEAELQAAREQLAVLRADLELAERGAQDAARDLGIAREQCAGLYHFAPNAYVTLDGNGFVRDANIAAADLLGEDRRRLRDKLFIRFVAGKDRRVYLRHLSRCRRSRYPAKTSDDLVVLGADGRRHQVRMLSVPDPEADPPHRMPLFRTALMDLSDIRRAENAIQESESRYRLLFESNPCPMFIFDEESLEFADVNESALRLYGYSREAFLAMTVRDIHLAEEVTAIEAALDAHRRLLRKARRTPRTGVPVGAGVPLSVGEWRQVRRDGTVFDAAIAISAIPHAGRHARLVLVNDITEQKRAESVLRDVATELERRVRDRTAALHESVDHLQSILCAANVVAWEMDPASGALVEIGPVAEFFGMPEGFRHESLEAFLESVHPDDREGLLTHARHVIRGQERACVSEFRVVLADGRIRWVGVAGSIERDDAGRPTRCRGIYRDVTARKDAEAALAQTHRALRVLTECDRALLRASSERQLLREACRIAVDVGQYRMAWVGYAEQDAARTVRPMELVGHAKEYLSGIRVSWADCRLGRGPTGTCIRTRKTTLCRDVTKDPKFQPWRSAVLKQGCASVLALPLLSEDGCLGALTIYAAQPNAFGDSETQLLKQLAKDLSFGILALRGRDDRTRLEREVLDISEREQRRIGQDLHDGVGQSLTGIRYLLSAVQQAMLERAAPEAAELDRIGQMLGLAQRQAHDLTRGLFPGEWSRGEIADALQDLAAYTQDVFGIACRFTRLTDAERMDPHVAGQVYRIAQEAVTNAAKHSQSKSIEIRLLQKHGRLALTVQDRGTGIPREKWKTDGMGLRILKYRADRIGACLKIRSVWGRGTTVSCVLPPSERERNGTPVGTGGTT